ncbi:MAG TPA: TonB C-terminal domain-containing protein [Candidatus Cybelea sp.]|jgi:TonB C terminal|nr:TonB C-terminal domain-containing protein [Candidatus Cybelea sp.]
MKPALALMAMLVTWIPVWGQQGAPPPPKILGMGVEIVSDTQGVDFTPYIRKLLATLERHAEAVMPESARMGETGILYTTVQIDPNGRLGTSDPVLERKSGKKDLDDNATIAIHASSPFDPLPSQFRGPYLKLRLVFMYNRVQLHAH